MPVLQTNICSGVMNQPTEQNSGLRKICKGYPLGRDPGYKKYVYQRRDLMPDCVLKLVQTQTGQGFSMWGICGNNVVYMDYEYYPK